MDSVSFKTLNEIEEVKKKAFIKESEGLKSYPLGKSISSPEHLILGSL